MCGPLVGCGGTVVPARCVAALLIGLSKRLGRCCDRPGEFLTPPVKSSISSPLRLIWPRPPLPPPPYPQACCWVAPGNPDILPICWRLRRLSSSAAVSSCMNGRTGPISTVRSPWRVSGPGVYAGGRSSASTRIVSLLLERRRRPRLARGGEGDEIRRVVRREGSGGGVCERRRGEDAGGGEKVRPGIRVCVGGGPLGGVKIDERDSGGDALDEERDCGERAGRFLGVWVGGGPLGGVKMREKDSGGDALDEDRGDGETVRVVLGCV